MRSMQHVFCPQKKAFTNSFCCHCASSRIYAISSGQLVAKSSGIQVLTAGRAKNDIPSKAQHEAMILPGHVMGTVSP